jgi:signal peptide peptidase SppA
MNSRILIAELCSQPWAMMPDRLTAIVGVLERWRNDQAADPDDFINACSGGRATARSGPAVAGIQIINLIGPISQRGSILDAIFSGGTVATQSVSQTLQAALKDDSVAAVILNIDSAGGSVSGVQELADEVYAARSVKPVTAVANSLAASAAFWIGASATEFYCTPGGEVGSIGIVAAHTDTSRALEMAGVRPTIISAGKFKTELSSLAPITAEARAAVQTRLDAYYATMTRSIARGRNTTVDKVRNGMGEGRVLTAQRAVNENMVDGALSLDGVIAKLGGALRDGKSPRARVARAGASSAGAPPKSQAQLRYERRARNLDLHG